MPEAKPYKYIYADDLSSLAVEIHDYFTEHPLATHDDIGYVGWRDFFDTIMKNYVIDCYQNYN